MLQNASPVAPCVTTATFSPYLPAPPAAVSACFGLLTGLSLHAVRASSRAAGNAARAQRLLAAGVRMGRFLLLIQRGCLLDVRLLRAFRVRVALAGGGGGV